MLDEMRGKKLVFMHLPKTGGTTLHDLLIEQFKSDQVCPERFNNLESWDEKDLQPFTFFSGHFDWDGVQKIPGKKSIISFLRDPVDRILSLYYFWRAHRWDVIEKNKLEGPRSAKNLDLVDFLKQDHPAILSNIDNVLVRSFLGKNRVGEGGGFVVPAGKSQLDAVPLALDNAKKMDCLGFLEAMDSSIAQVFAKQGFMAPDEIPHTRNSKDPKELERQGLEHVEKFPITDEIEDLLFKVCWADLQFYYAALEHFWPKISLHEANDFGKSNKYLRSLSDHWSAPDGEGCWMLGKKGRVDIRMDVPARYVRLKLEMDAYLPSLEHEMTLNVVRPDGRVFSKKFGQLGMATNIDVLVRREDIDPKLGLLSLKLETDSARSPADFGKPDARTLSVRMRKIRVESVL